MEEKVIQPDDTLKSSCHQEVPALYSSASKGPSCSKVAHTTSPDLHVRAHAPSRAPRGGTPRLSHATPSLKRRGPNPPARHGHPRERGY
jgi:hypothetical protein